LSAEDVRRMQGERARVEDGLEKALATKQQHSKELWEAETELNKVCDELEAAASVFNSKATELQLIPETAKHSQGKKFKIVVHKELAEESDTNAMLGNVDIKNEARPVIAQLKETMTGNMNVAKQELLNLLDQEEQAEEQLKEALSHATTLENRARRAEEQYNKEKEQLDATIAELVAETEEAETKTTQLRDPMALETAIARNQTRLNQLKALREEKLEAAAARKEAVHNEILKALNMCADHKDYIQMQLGDLKAYGEEKLQMLQGGITEKKEAVAEVDTQEENVNAGADELPPPPTSA